MLYISGVNFAPEPLNATSRNLIDTARAAGVPMSIDFNYRLALYGSEENYRSLLLPLLPEFQIVKGSREDFRILFGSDNLKDVAADILARIILPSGELPVAVVSAFLGAPVLI